MKSQDKNKLIPELKASVHPILVVNNFGKKPFLELFETYPENALLQPLGTLTGFFKINDESDDSAYIVNFLTSVIKKEYFINHRRPVDKSFDSALHRINLALAEITKNGNILWIGKLDGAVCVIENGILHFSACGKAKILLIRNQVLSDLSSDFSSEEREANPLKTFTSVSSGSLEQGDKLIITSADIFSVFSLNELTKGALRFTPEKFVQFIKTALINELDLASTIIVDIEEKVPEKKRIISSELKADELNPFSEKAFQKPASSEKTEAINRESDKEYTDQKTGHIYIQGEDRQPEENSATARLQDHLGELTLDFWHWIKNFLKKISLSLKEMSSRLVKRIFSRKPLPNGENNPEQAARDSSSKINSPQINPAKEASSKQKREFGQLLREKLFSARSRFFTPAYLRLLLFFKKIGQTIFFARPRFSKIKERFSLLSYQQKLYALGTIIFILVVPALALKLKRSSPPLPLPEEPRIETVSEKLKEEKNWRPLPELQTVSSLSGITNTLFLNGKLFAHGASKIVSFEEPTSPKEYPLPQGAQIKFISPLEDLNLILILTGDGKVLSWSPISKQFKENTINLPEISSVRGMATYLTYLYVVDGKENQIYRYPRAEGGFRERTKWLKDSQDLSEVTAIAINENVFLVSANQVWKFFQGKKQDFNLENTKFTLKISTLLATRDVENLYVLDKENERIISFSGEGKILSQYHHPLFKEARDLSFDKEKNIIYFSTPEAIFSFGL